jgi:hypothetical protein
MNVRPIDDDMSGLLPVQLAALSETSGDFAVARRLISAVAAQDSAGVAELMVEIEHGVAPGLVALACAVEAVRFAQEPAISGSRLESMLAAGALRQIDPAEKNRQQFGDGH